MVGGETLRDKKKLTGTQNERDYASFFFLVRRRYPVNLELMALRPLAQMRNPPGNINNKTKKNKTTVVMDKQFLYVQQAHDMT